MGEWAFASVVVDPHPRHRYPSECLQLPREVSNVTFLLSIMIRARTEMETVIHVPDLPAVMHINRLARVDGPDIVVFWAHTWVSA